MKKWKLILMQLAVFALFVFAGSAAYADLPGASHYWTATPSGSNMWAVSLTIPSDIAASNTFSLYSWADPSQSLLILDPAHNNFFNTIAIQPFSPLYLAFSGVNAISLGSTPEFGFSFSRGTDTYYTYTLTQLATNSWTLANSETGSIINIQGNVTPSAVPLPGSLLLLGSGLLGLLGIGSRRNKGQVA